MKSQRAAVIVEGAGLQTLHYQRLVNGLSEAGFIIRCPHLPTNGDPNRPPKATLEDSVAVLQAEIRELKAAGHPILLIMHSAGGGVGSQAATPEMYANDPGAGGIAALMYLCAHIVQPGESITSTIGKLQLVAKKTYQTHDFSEEGIVTVLDPLDYFFSELDDRYEAKALADTVVTSNVAIAVTPITRAPWKDLPTTYLLTTKDRVLLPEHQKEMAREAFAQAKNMQMIELSTGHFPFLTETERTVNLAREMLPQT